MLRLLRDPSPSVRSLVSRICDDPARNPNTDISSIRCAAVIGVEAGMEMHEIKYFLAACRTLNFHRAAELSHVSQPALTPAPRTTSSGAGTDVPFSFASLRMHCR